jgi:hypothetical protein
MPFLEKIAVGLGAVRIQQAVGARDAAKYGEDVFRPSEDAGRAMPTRLTGVGIDDESSRVCGADGCSSWLMPWKNRRRPIFEEEWGCSNKCMLKMVRASVRRELTEGGSIEESRPHRHRVPLGLVLLAQGWITHPQLQAALESQRVKGEGRIGDWLVQGGLDEDRVTRGLGVQWNCPVLSADGFAPARMGMVMPKRFVSEFGMLPLRIAGSSILYVAFEDRMDAGGAMGLEQMTGLKVESGLLSRSQFVDVRARLLEADGIPVTMDVAPDADALAEKVAKLVELAQPLASRLVRIHQYYWLRIWLESGAMSGLGNLPSSPEDVQDYLFTIGSQG